ncbi:fatty acid desaturase [Brevifollis gellanilyticus]|uniref:Alkane 1-monooxygenase 2 n=1 Tax=Brevifollis gellanilyticus TaxID=748831 RepID=A0A512M2P2_9BACT|nr:fatty acid desaturase [Brevifollis gellanilyticus]GEP41000.1 alkane 1-monooxygenase 2 [Brevifollis gellanilyticus]
MDTPSGQPLNATAKTRHLLWCLLPQVLIVLFWTGWQAGGLWLALPSVFLMVIVPGLDWLTGWQDDQGFEKAQFSGWELSLLHWNVRLYALFYMVAVVWSVASLERFSPLELGLLLAACSLMAGIGFGAGHELLHGKELPDQVMQRLLTSFLFYPHYKLIHIRSHHVHAGTDEDENTAWMNETLYAYLFRTIPGSAVRCWQMEMRRVNSLYGQGLPALLRNRMLGYVLGQIAILASMAALGGIKGFAFFLLHLIGAHVILESVNYIQHYGLLRKMSDGQYEKTGPEHSWDTYHFFSSYITFRVGHHSNHHIAVRPYYLLYTQPEAPKLPVGYFWAIALVMIPPWWRHVAHPRLGPQEAA